MKPVSYTHLDVYKRQVQRHETIGRLLCLINGTQDELEEVEKIEHFLSPRTVLNIRKFLEQQEKK